MTQTKSHIPLLFDSDPYYDDFSVDKGFLRHLFKPGYGIQARELTQIQSILQNQIERLSNHIFENGSVVAGGEVVEGRVHWVRVSIDTPIEELDTLVGETLKNGDDDAISGRIVYTLPGIPDSGDDEGQIIFFTPNTVGTFAPDEKIKIFQTDNLETYLSEFDVASNEQTNENSVGTNAMMVTINEGFFFIDGFFVYSTKQSIVPYNTTVYTTDGGAENSTRIFSDPTASIGLSISRIILNSSEDETLRDPASGFNNFNAPGSDRYKLDLTIKSVEFEGSVGDAYTSEFTDDYFVEMIRVVDGNTTKKIEYSEYSEIENTLARRTFDESGHYTIGSPKMRVVLHSSAFDISDDDNKFAVGIDPHKSYVSGFELETQAPIFLSVNKPKDTQWHEAENIDLTHGNYFVLDEENTHFLPYQDGFSSVPAHNVLHGQRHFLRRANGVTFGTCNLVSVRKVNTEYRAYINNLELQDESNIGDVHDLAWGTTAGFAAPGGNGSTGSKISIKEYGGSRGPMLSGYKSLLFPTTGNNTITEDGLAGNNTKLAVQLMHVEYNADIFSDPDGLVITPNIASSIDDYGTDDPTPTGFLLANVDPIVVGEDGRIIDASVGWDGPNGKIMKIYSDEDVDSGHTEHISIFYFAYLEFNNADSPAYGQTKYRQLSKESGNNIGIRSSEISEINGIEYVVFTLSQSHVRNITSLIDGNGGGSFSDDEISETILDDGQRSYAYIPAQLHVPKSLLNGVGDWYEISVMFFYNKHGGIGPVTIDSYLDAGYDYDDIPSFIDRDSGKFYRLQKYIDFRPIQKPNGAFHVNQDSYVFGLPFDSPVEPSHISYNRYVPRTDSVIVGEDRTLSVVEGVSGLLGEPPQSNKSDMVLYHIDIEPYVFDFERDVNVRHIDNRRYTMNHVGKIRNENDIRYRSDVYRNLLSDAIARSTEESEMKDTDGVTWSIFPISEGILVDDFTGHAFSDVSGRDHNCSMDNKLGGLHSPFSVSSIGRRFDLSAKLVQSEDMMVTYKYEDNGVSPIVRQNSGTRTIFPNPYGEVDYLGFVKLQPSSDFFYDQTRPPYVLTNTHGENNAYQIGLSAHQVGRSYGYGTTNKEYIFHWFGFADNTFQLGNVDPLNREYVSPIINQTNRYPDRIIRTVGDRSVDESVIPYMRDVDIDFDATNLFPGSTVYAFFDSVKVGNEEGYSVTHSGSCEGTISIPTSTFSSGEKSFRLIDREDNDNELSNTLAETKFFSQGLYGDSDNTSPSYRQIETRKRSVNSPDIIDYTYERTQEDNYSPVIGGIEPLAQEIVVDSSRYPHGIYIFQIDLFFRGRDPDHPISIQLRPMELGVPHPNKVIPLSTVTREGVTNYDNEPTAATAFTFSSPVYLKPGRYAVCVITNGSEHEIFSATVGETILGSNGNVFNKDSGIGIKMGSLFNPINNGSRIEDPNSVLAMNIYKCTFDTSEQAEITIKRTGDEEIPTHSFIVSGNRQPHGSGFMQPTASVMGIDSEINSEIEFSKEEVIKHTTSASIKFPVGSDTSDISPIIDLDRVGLLSVHSKALAHDPTDTTSANIGELRGTAGSASNIARYVSKRMTLPDRMANDMLVCLKAYGKVRVYVKTSSGGSEDFDSIPWKELRPTDRVSSGADEYPQDGNQTTDGILRDYYFRPSGPLVLGNYNTYSIKIVLFKEALNCGQGSFSYAKELRAIPLYNKERS